MKNLYIDGKKIIKVFHNGKQITVVIHNGVKIWEDLI